MAKENISIDDVLQQTIGTFSRWHVFTISIIALVKVSIQWHQLGIVFLGPPAKFRCSLNTTADCSPECPSHEFDRSIFTETIITEWDLVCHKAQLANVSQLIFMFGILLGNVVFGCLSDRYGRRNPLLWAVMLQIVSGIATAFTPWLWLFMTLRFLCAIATGGTMLTSFVLLMEIVGKEHRMTFGVLFQLPSICGHAIMGLVGYLLRDWHHFQIAISTPSILLLSCYWLLPESPRWLLTVGRSEEAIEALKKAASFSGRPIDSVNEIVIKYVKQETLVQKKPGNLVDLFRTYEARKRSVCIFLCWLICGLTYYAAAQYMGRIGGNIFLNVSLVGLILIPGNFITLYMLHKFTRKRTLAIMNLLGALSCLMLIFIPNELNELVAALGLLGISGIAGSFTVLYVYSGELYPTVIRNVGLGMASMSARFGSMIAPFVASLDEVNKWLAPLLFGIGPLLCILLCVCLPETSNANLPDTIEEAEIIGTSKSDFNNEADEIH